jgi:NitT/TauT family transport system substrate-binding protein
MPLIRAALSLFGLVLTAALAAGHASAADKIRAGTPATDVFGFAILDAAIDGGFFTRHGLEVERIDFAGGAKEHQAMTAGALDIAVTTGADILFVIRGAPEKAVAATSGAPVSIAITARPDAGISSIGDLKGRSVGTTALTSMTSWVVMEISRRQGWGPDGITRVAVGSTPSMVAALTTRNVDAICGSITNAYRLAAEGKGKVVVRAADVITTFISDMLFASDDMIRDRPDALRRFLSAWFETVAFMKSDKSAAIRLTEKDTQLPPDLASKVYDEEMPDYRTDGHFDARDFAAVKQSLLDLGLVTTMPPDAAMLRQDFLP